MTNQDALVLAHGAFHGPWCWEPLIHHLELAGVHCVAVDLNRGGLAADRDALHEAIDALRDDGHRVHAMGHSLGCASVASIDPARLASAVLLAGSVPPVGGMPPLTHTLAPGFLELLMPQPDGRAAIRREDARRIFYHRCDPARAEWALDRLRPTFVYLNRASEPILWETIPVTYVACAQDRTVAADYQREVARRMRHSAVKDSDHSPMLGNPEVSGSWCWRRWRGRRRPAAKRGGGLLNVDRPTDLIVTSPMPFPERNA